MFGEIFDRNKKKPVTGSFHANTYIVYENNNTNRKKNVSLKTQILTHTHAKTVGSFQ